MINTHKRRWNSIGSLGGIVICVGLLLLTQSFQKDKPPSEPVLSPGERKPPNVILIITDDQGYGDFSVHGNPVLKTPVLDGLYRQSIRFTDYHSSPMCSPTRGQLMTGRDAVDNGCTAVCLGRSMVREELPTMAQVFKASGYQTAHFGKWHMGDSYPYRPQDRGFDKTVHHGAYGIESIPDHYENNYWSGYFKDENSRFKKYDNYCTDEWFDLSIDYITKAKDHQKPFFLYIATNAPHWPHLVDDKYSAPYTEKGVRPLVAKFFGQVANLDENMGRLLKTLEETGLDRNTVVIYTTDNGTVLGHEVFNAGMRGNKTLPYEGGHRVPLFIRWPDGNLGQPRDIDNLVQVQDLLPTLIDLCGLKRPGDADFDGSSLMPLLTGKDTLADRILVVEYDNPYKPKENKAVLWKKWRLVKNEELYNLASDPGQQKDVAADHPEVVRKLQQHYEEWKADALKGYNQARYIHVGTGHQNPSMLYSPDWTGDYADTRYDLIAGNRKGSWDIQVEEAGKYEVTLYRWQPESKRALTASIIHPEKNVQAGAVPIARARLRVDGFEKTVDTKRNQTDVKFMVPLESGRTKVETMFLDSSGNELCSAYYTSIRLVNKKRH